MQFMVLGSIILAGVAVCVATWFPRHKRGADWFMVAGATMTAFALISLTIIFEVLHYYNDLWLGTICYGMLGGGAVLFAMGYVMDRIGRRKEQDFQQAARHLPPPGAPGPPPQ